MRGFSLNQEVCPPELERSFATMDNRLSGRKEKKGEEFRQVSAKISWCESFVYGNLFRDSSPIPPVYRTAVAILAFKVAKGIVPGDITSPLHPCPARSSRRQTSFEVPFTRHEFIRQAFGHHLPVVWSEIPRGIRRLRSVKTFRFVLSSFIKLFLRNNEIMIQRA